MILEFMALTQTEKKIYPDPCLMISVNLHILFDDLC